MLLSHIQHLSLVVSCLVAMISCGSFACDSSILCLLGLETLTFRSVTQSLDHRIMSLR